MSEYGIPYMGSKASIATSICMMLPKADHFYDLFGGGFSMTHCMVKRFAHKYTHFHYNEIKQDIVGLVKSAINGDYSYGRFKPEWISRELFLARKDTDAYIRCIWSFGNNQKGYLFGDIEPYKKSMHNAVVFDDFDSLAESVFGFSIWPLNVKTIKQRRFYLRQKIEFYRQTKVPEVLYEFINSEQLQGLERLQQLQRLEQLEQLQRLQFYSRSYDEIEILPNSIVYCDIPYEGTSDYGAFNRSKFLDWAASRDFPVYISEYGIYDQRFKPVYQIEKRSLLSSKAIYKIKKEILYWNGKNNAPNL